MRLTWKDGATAVVAACVVAVALAVVQGWNWPMTSSIRAGIGVVAVAGIAMCSLGGSRYGEAVMRGLFGAIGSALGAVALVLIVWGLVAPSEELLVALAADILALWVLSTVRHTVQVRSGNA